MQDQRTFTDCSTVRNPDGIEGECSPIGCFIALSMFLLASFEYVLAIVALSTVLLVSDIAGYLRMLRKTARPRVVLRRNPARFGQELGVLRPIGQLRKRSPACAISFRRKGNNVISSQRYSYS